MVIKTASPGVFVQEVDLTRGVVDPVSSNVGICVGPFQRGPVDEVVRINTEVELREVFGKPTDENFEYWWSINNFLEYSGQCYVVRCDDAVGDVIDDSIPDGLGTHDQKMRNATDAYIFGQNEASTLSDINQQLSTSPLYIKNEDTFASEPIIANGGKFIGRNPGRWPNGVGIAVIDKGADFRLRLASSLSPISTDYLLVVNGGDSSEELGWDELDGGTAAEALIDPLNFDDPGDGRTEFSDETIVGTRLVQYAKFTTQNTIFNFSEVAGLEEADQGDLPTSVPSGYDYLEDTVTATYTLIDTATTTDGDGEGLLIDVKVSTDTGNLLDARISLKGATKPKGYKVGDEVYTTIVGANTQATLRITDVRELKGTVIRIGNSQDGVIGTIQGEENGIYSLAVAAHSDGTFGTATIGENISDPQIGGQSIGTVEDYVIMGHYMFYGRPGDKAVDVVWEPKEYTREEGMSWLWPNQPFAGELVFSTKIAKNVNGVPIQAEGSTAQNPIYERLRGPAKLTASTGNVIYWHKIKERWVQQYQPKVGDFVYDSYVNPNSSDLAVYPFPILDAYDWYSQQVAFEGIPWVQFAPRPGTSAHAEMVGAEDDEVNILVFDALGDYETIGGEAPRKGRVLESYSQASKLKDATTPEGSNNYYRDLINRDSAIIYANEPLDIIDNNRDLDASLEINTLNQGRVLPGTKIAFGIKCALLMPRFGSIDFDNPNKMSTRVSPSGVSEVTFGDNVASAAGFPSGVYETVSLLGGYGLRLSVVSDSNGKILNVVPALGYDLQTEVSYFGTNYNYGDLVTITKPGDSSSTVNFKVKSLQQIVNSPYILLGGEDQLTASLGEVQHAYSKVLEDNIADLDYVIQGPAYDATLAAEQGLNDTLENSTDYQQKISYAVAKANFLISLADNRLDCVAVVSPPRNAALDPIDANQTTENIVEWANRISSSSYGIIDSGYKYMYDRFRDKFCYVPLNADVAGCMTRTSLVSQPFFSPAGMARGQIKNAVKLGFDPSKNNRDLLYTARVNPVCNFPGEGTILYGDKTALGYSSAFTRINVRKLFIYCEKAIARLSRSVLFEFNDTPTRLNFVNTVNPFMTDIVSKRGAIDFLVVCDTSNNTPDVIDRNEFVADIYIKPNRSINFVQLTFVATKTGVSFGEAVAVNRRTSS